MPKTFKILCAMFVITSALSLGACNTMEGLGRDAAAAGKAITGAASDNKGY